MPHKLGGFLEERQISAAELARQLGVSPAVVSLVVNEKRPESGEFRLRFAAKYGMKKTREVFGEPLPGANEGGTVDAEQEPQGPHSQAPALAGAA